MRKSAIWRCALSALSLGMVLTGCSTVAPTEGAGFQHVPFKPASVTYLNQNDPVGLNKTIANNRRCRAAPACKKAPQ